MYSRIAIFLLFVMVACIGTRICAQDNTPNNVPKPPSQSDFPPMPLPPPPGVPNLQLAPVEPLPKVLPGDCSPAQHWGPGGCVAGAPEMGVSESAGIPWEAAMDILARHRDELHRIPGVMASGLGADGIILLVLPTHGDIPAAVEGLPILTRPYHQPELSSHTVTTRVRPVHGGIAFGTSATIPAPQCTMTTVALAHGDPWVVSASHCLGNISCPGGPTPPNCPTGTQLWQCPRYSTPNLLLYQPASPGALPANVMGWVQRYAVQGGTAQRSSLDRAERNPGISVFSRLRFASSGLRSYAQDRLWLCYPVLRLAACATTAQAF